MNGIRASAVILLLCALDSGFVGARAVTRISIAASPEYSIEPGFVDLVIRHTPRDGDRDLVVEIESADLFRSSVIPLEGSDAPSFHSTRFRGLPKGDYAARVWLERNDEEAMRAETSFHVAGINETPLPR